MRQNRTMEKYDKQINLLLLQAKWIILTKIVSLIGFFRILPIVKSNFIKNKLNTVFFVEYTDKQIYYYIHSNTMYKSKHTYFCCCNFSIDAPVLEISWIFLLQCRI